ncbi:putative sporulation protein YyaC [Bacillus sp. SORGH_AS 510]|uniref:spore protease YyaC n=1 Tax=Bacillus sp. SORGH_AS_0510 TaxID=3041771 RepID=UPI002789CC2B|nr:spore protease YyaC [Bacillus sp. SORGH_AS_0510]MDQ1145733.1 putative sporulation protein YyaC [Bacillus sp. SORGH_AS_0510]
MWIFNGKKKKIKKDVRVYYCSEKQTEDGTEFRDIINKLNEVFHSTSQQVVILCIGSDRSTGDSLGPLVGTMLKKSKISFPVYGTLEEPVHALNIKKILKEIVQIYQNPFILGIDACLGDERQIGYILLKEGPLIPGMALNKSLPSVGDYHMNAIVNYLDPLSPGQSLNTTRLFVVMRLAESISKIITDAALIEGSFTDEKVIEKNG